MILLAVIINIGIPVVGHIGLTPQSFHQMSGYSIQGKTKEAAKHIVSDAIAVEKAGAFALVLEGIPSELAKEKLLNQSPIPTIGIGVGLTAMDKFKYFMIYLDYLIHLSQNMPSNMHR